MQFSIFKKSTEKEVGWSRPVERDQRDVERPKNRSQDHVLGAVTSRIEVTSEVWPSGNYRVYEESYILVVSLITLH